MGLAIEATTEAPVGTERAAGAAEPEPNPVLDSVCVSPRRVRASSAAARVLRATASATIASNGSSSEEGELRGTLEAPGRSASLDVGVRRLSSARSRPADRYPISSSDRNVEVGKLIQREPIDGEAPAEGIYGTADRCSLAARPNPRSASEDNSK